MKIKLFTKTTKQAKTPAASAEFEDEIAAWLNSNPGIEIKHIKQSAGAGSMGPFLFFVSVWYEEHPH